MADGQLVPYYDVCNPHALLCLLERILVPMELRIDCTELQVQTTLELQLVDPG